MENQEFLFFNPFKPESNHNVKPSEQPKQAEQKKPVFVKALDSIQKQFKETIQAESITVKKIPDPLPEVSKEAEPEKIVRINFNVSSTDYLKLKNKLAGRNTSISDFFRRQLSNFLSA